MSEFKLPELGENIESGNVVKVSVKQGDQVKKEQTILELETDKATIEIPSPQDGTIAEILVSEGEDVKVGQPIVKFGESGQSQEAPEESKEEKKEKDTGKEKDKEKAEETGEKESVGKQPPKAAATPEPVQTSRPAKDVPAAPSVRRLARELGVDITQVPGSGAHGRIAKDDVKAFVKQSMSRQPTGAAGSGGVAQQPLPDFSKWGQVERKPMNNIRKKTAKHLSYAWQTIPHVTQFDKVDITDLEKLRKQYSNKERKLTITPFLMKVIASALKAFPQFNSSVDLDNEEIIYKKYTNIGVAVDTENGLLVPVIRDVASKSIFDLAEELNHIAQKARDRKLSLEDMTGGSFTITNLGGIGGTSFTPIVNPPEVAILGVSRARLEPNYTESGGVCQPALMLPLSLSYDHRIIDGADGARFLRWVTEAIRQPFLMEMS